MLCSEQDSTHTLPRALWKGDIFICKLAFVLASNMFGSTQSNKILLCCPYLLWPWSNLLGPERQHTFLGAGAAITDWPANRQTVCSVEEAVSISRDESLVIPSIFPFVSGWCMVKHVT